MIIRLLVGLMHEDYPEQFAPEVLMAVDEFTHEANEDHWEAEKKRVLADGYDKNFHTIGEVHLRVDGNALRRAILPQTVAAAVEPSPADTKEKL